MTELVLRRVEVECGAQEMRRLSSEAQKVMTSEQPCPAAQDLTESAR
jgi:hypothetical protein